MAAEHLSTAASRAFWEQKLHDRWQETPVCMAGLALESCAGTYEHNGLETPATIILGED